MLEEHILEELREVPGMFANRNIISSRKKNRKQEKEMRKIRFRTLFELEMFAVVFPRRQCSKF